MQLSPLKVCLPDSIKSVRIRSLFYSYCLSLWEVHVANKRGDTGYVGEIFSIRDVSRVFRHDRLGMDAPERLRCFMAGAERVREGLITVSPR
jgi:preprotein translocase subunit Sec63